MQQQHNQSPFGGRKSNTLTQQQPSIVPSNHSAKLKSQSLPSSSGSVKSTAGGQLQKGQRQEDQQQHLQQHLSSQEHFDDAANGFDVPERHHQFDHYNQQQQQQQQSLAQTQILEADNDSRQPQQPQAIKQQRSNNLKTNNKQQQVRSSKKVSLFVYIKATKLFAILESYQR